jgi:hypothetical protein
MKRAIGTMRTALFCASAAFGAAGCGAAMSKDAVAPSPPAGGAAEFAPMDAAPAQAPAPQAPSRAKTEAPQEVSGGGKARASAELLAYEASVTVGVYQVEQAISAVLAASRELGGQIVIRNDAQVVFRVPRARFEEALGRIDQVGDVVHRDVRAEDVGDRYRDLEVRLRNSRAVRDRLAELLARANSVEDSLKIEAQLGRVTEEIERIAGELELLGSRVAYSKITVLFQARHTEQVHEEVMRLPFPWLKTLGLPKLLDLQEESK